jgi:hypothetical protein
MPDYRTMYDSEWLHEYDLTKDEVTVEIASVEAGELTSQGGRKSKKPCIKFKGADKALALNKTNGKAIAQLYGTDVSEWPGKKVTLFRSTTEMAGETVRCIRIKKPA